ncbi:Arginyl-tRNA synthetase [hydrothermal vent metagenome]|uniref:arginine--tRNA ligase n=1 Tax=hydrothermal vent metagenome TaxID=652676 RepID=A0A3B0R399_9ZZZZ
MRAILKNIIADALKGAKEEGLIKSGIDDISVILERPKREKFGDFSTNLAMLLTKSEGRAPRTIAEDLIKGINASDLVEKCEVAGPGFINIFLKRSYWLSTLAEILKKGGDYGNITVGEDKPVQVEFVSANPTGPLHIGHGRGAAVGDALANILKAAGYDVTKEYYINDAGRQVHNLGESIGLRLKELQGEEIELGENHYKGDYIIEIAKEYVAAHPSQTDATTEDYKNFAIKAMLGRIEKDLVDFGIVFDEWFSETSLDDKDQVTSTIEELTEKGLAFDKDGAKWMRTTDFGDDKDRVLIKADGARTYFASDIAYHRDKIRRGFTKIINVWGADHHGYEPRIRALFRAFGHDDEMLRVVFIQLVALLRDGEPVAMGKRSGEFVTLRQVMDEVGTDACRFFFLMRKPDAHLDFDLELAKKQASDNPVFYVQYAHARIHSIERLAREKGIELPDTVDVSMLEGLALPEETAIIKHLAAFEDVIEKSAASMEPHKVTFYLQELAGLYHPYYNRNRVVTNDKAQTIARLMLCKAVAQVIRRGLALLGVSAPESM